MSLAEHEETLAKAFFLSIFKYSQLMFYGVEQNQVLQNTFNMTNLHLLNSNLKTIEN
jgi:hypothetical protein